MLKSLLSICLSIVCVANLWSQQEVYSIIQLNDIQDIPLLATHGIAVDHLETDAENNYLLTLSQSELNIIQLLNVSYSVKVTNYQENYLRLRNLDANNRIIKNNKSTQGFDLGSMGGFYTFQEMEDKLDEMRQDFPSIVSEKQQIGTSLEGNPIWMVKISDNPAVDEEEPVAYFDALHHAREPLSMGTTINYMFYLLENYATNPAVKYLVDHRELYFVPVVNPDGYIYNETTNPDGGGLWRKNRRVVSANCIGVDLNRNYSFAFANDGSCSSDNACSEVYSGEVPFSEPETAAVRDVLELIEPKTAFSTHSTAGIHLMPYGYNTMPPDFEIYSEWASAFLDENDYVFGVTFQLLGYTSCGTTRDYLHSEGIYGWTPEIGGSGFWPMPSTILDLVSENIRPMLYQSWIAGGYVDVQSHSQIGDAIIGDSFQLEITLKNVGLVVTDAAVTCELRTDNPNIAISEAADYGNIAARGKATNIATPFTIAINDDFEGASFDLEIISKQGNAENEKSSITILVGEKVILFSDNAETGTSNWIATGNNISWGTSLDDSYSGTKCFADSPGGNGMNATESFFELNQSFDLSQTSGPLVSFMTKFSHEEADLSNFQISIDNSASWENLDAYSQNESWNHRFYPLNEYKDFNEVRFRFRTFTNENRPGDGFYFDDFKIENYAEEVLDILSQDIKSITAKPNPFLNSIEIAHPQNSIKSINLYTISGNLLAIEPIFRDSSSFVDGLGSLSTGIYFLKVETISGKVSSYQMIKK
jgi:carboxypeptidase T